MKKSTLMMMVLIAATIAFAEGKPQTTCPVMGGKINKSLYVDADGVRIYVCCKGCIGKVKADPQKYIKQMQAKGVELKKTPATKGKKSDTDHGQHNH